MNTSQEAFKSVSSVASTMQEQVFDLIQTKVGGLTCDEVEVISGLRHQTASARIRELVEQNRVIPTDLRRPTRSGRHAIVWSAKRVLLMQ